MTSARATHRLSYHIFVMPYIRDTVIVLKKEPFREQDRRYVMYGREHGLLEAIARGAALHTSKQAGHLEPFSLSEVMIAKGISFDKLAVARLVDTPYRAFKDHSYVTTFAICGACADLILRLIHPGVPDARIFQLLWEVIVCAREFPQNLSPARARLFHAAATVRLLDLLGFGPVSLGELDASHTETRNISRLLQVMRRGALGDVLRVTAPRSVLNAASEYVEVALRQTHLEQEPHGVRTIWELVTTSE